MQISEEFGKQFTHQVTQGGRWREVTYQAYAIYNQVYDAAIDDVNAKNASEAIAGLMKSRILMLPMT